jgi:hypothetical protein
MLSTKDLNWQGRIARKFSLKFIGPFMIKKVLSPLVYELQLPSSLPIHPTFHISKLRKYIDDEGQFPGREQNLNRDQPPPDFVNDEPEYEVEAIRQHRLKKWRGEMHKQYLVKWKGYPEWENTWEWWDSLIKAKKLVDAYNRKHKQD